MFLDLGQIVRHVVHKAQAAAGLTAEDIARRPGATDVSRSCSCDHAIVLAPGQVPL